MNIVIIDDDKLVRKGIQQSIDWDSLGLHFAGDAANGRLGLELCQRVRPQIAIVDIKMPVMDGLEFTRALRDILPDTRVIILSGHGEFEYALAAIRLGVRNYLLKPAKPDELIEVVTQLRDEILEEHRAAQEEGADALAEHLDLVRAHYLAALISGNASLDAQALDRYARIGLSLEGSYHWVLLADIEDYSRLEPGHTGTQLRALQQQVAGSLQDALAPACGHNAFWTGENRLCALLHGPAASDPEAPARLIGRFQALARERVEVRLAVAIGGPVASLQELPEAYGKAARSIAYDSIAAAAMRYVAEHFAENITVPRMAEHVHVTANHFSRAFTQETGLRFIDYLNKYRVQQAKLLLEVGQLRTYEVADRCGYSDYKYFHYIFTKYEGCSPTRYVEQLRDGHAPEGAE